MTTAFSIRDLSYTYSGADAPALDHITLDIPVGVSMALLGPNGAGKSTLMDILLHWKKAPTGAVTLFGADIATHTHRDISLHVSLVPQEEQSQFAFSVLDYVLFGRAPYLGYLSLPTPEDLSIARGALHQTGILHLEHRSVIGLSGGEHQLLLLARAIAQQTPVMLLDEPTSALDPANTARVLSILRNLHARGTTLLFTTHDPSLAAELATHVAMLKNGRLLATGTESDILNAEKLTALYDTPIHTVQHENQKLVFRARP